MERFTTHTGILVPLRREAVDTDQIVPSVYMKSVSRTGYGDALFATWRQDENFVLNQSSYDRGSILVAGAAFGSGSSREHAVWALRDAGFKAVLAPSFADIFAGNAGKHGLLTAVIDEEMIDALCVLAERQPGVEASVDLVNRVVRVDGEDIAFAVDDYTRRRLLDGLDDIEVTLRNAEVIGHYEERRLSWLPRTQRGENLTSR